MIAAAQRTAIGQLSGTLATLSAAELGAHPIGASGYRILVTLLHEMAKHDARRGLATLCVGGGQGVALAVCR